MKVLSVRWVFMALVLFASISLAQQDQSRGDGELAVEVWSERRQLTQNSTIETVAEDIDDGLYNAVAITDQETSNSNHSSESRSASKLESAPTSGPGNTVEQKKAGPENPVSTEEPRKTTPSKSISNDAAIETKPTGGATADKKVRPTEPEQQPAAEESLTTASKSAEKGSESTVNTAEGLVKAGTDEDKKVRVAAKAVQILPMAPEVNVANDGDVDPEGACQEDITKFCKHVKLGENRVASCLSNLIAEQEADPSKEKHISDQCRTAVYDYKVEINKNINMNIALAKACKDDAMRLCNGTANLFKFKYKAGSVLACLKDAKQDLSKECKDEVFKIQYDAAMDFRADTGLFTACEGDAKRLCPTVEYGGGRVQECLRNQPTSNISWDCREKLFWQEVENSDDIRLSVRLFARCLQDKKKFCADIAPGNAVVKDCLEEHRNNEGFSEGCRFELEKMIERRVRDFRLDSRLRTTCMDDMAQLCSIVEYVDDEETSTGRESLVNCLQDYNKEIKNQECAHMVQKYQRLAAEDIRFASDLAMACYEDRSSYCSNVPPGSARVIRCLERHRARLSMVCRAQLFDEEVKFSANIDFQYPMKKTCKKEIKKFCAGIPHGNAQVIRCLQDKKNEKGFGEECRSEVKKYEHDSSQDYRFNNRLSTACKQDVEVLCTGLCKAEKGEVCGGRVLRCLIDKREDIKSEACSKEVQYFEKMQVSDFRNDVILAQACREDVEKHCTDADPDKEPGAVHKCLRLHYKELSEVCRNEEMQVEMMENENIELSPNLLKACKVEREMFCREVAAGSGRVFRCLADKMGDTDFGSGCLAVIRSKLQRRQANWRLDPPLRKQCKASVAKLCGEADSGLHTQPGAVVKCLVDQLEQVEPGCQKEMGRAVHMAFFTWQPQGALTEVCDEDVQRLCLARRPNMDQTPGAVASCLADVLEHQVVSNLRRLLATPQPQNTGRLSRDCAKLADIAIPQNLKKQFYDSLAFAFIASQLDKLQGRTGAMLAQNQRSDAQGIKLTGWTALAGMCALLVLLMYGAAALYRRYRGIPDHGDYTVVLKGKGTKPGR